MVTNAPCWMEDLAMASPMPLDAPVMNTCFPCREGMCAEAKQLLYSQEENDSDEGEGEGSWMSLEKILTMKKTSVNMETEQRIRGKGSMDSS